MMSESQSQRQIATIVKQCVPTLEVSTCRNGHFRVHDPYWYPRGLNQSVRHLNAASVALTHLGYKVETLSLGYRRGAKYVQAPSLFVAPVHPEPAHAANTAPTVPYHASVHSWKRSDCACGFLSLTSDPYPGGCPGCEDVG